MADRRRRRALEDEGEESAPVTGEQAPKDKPSECESEGEPVDTEVVSEYESATEDSRVGVDEEESEEGSEDEEEETEEETEEGSEEDDDDEEYTDDDVIVEGEDQIEEERQSGDGEEQPDKENVDDDDDKKNPAYVPRKGAFYEHDLRTGEEQAPEKDLKPKKKLWQDEGKWGHDRYSEDLQAPKSRDELIAIYGYDIRASDKPPDAPPRHKSDNRGGGPPSQRKSQLQDYMKPSRPPPQPQHQHQRMAVIDTTDYSTKQRTRPPPPPPDSFDYDEIIDVPFMTTIDTTESSADSYHPTHQRSRGVNRRGRDNRRSYGDRPGRGRGSHSQTMVSQDVRVIQSQDVCSPPSQDSRVQDSRSQESQSQDFRQQGYRSQNNRSREFRGQDDYRGMNNFRYNDNRDNREEDYAERNNYNQIRGSSRGGNRGGQFGHGSRGRDRNDRPPRYNKVEREAPTNQAPYDMTQREFTNASYKNPVSAYEGTANDGKNMQVGPAGAADTKGRQTSQDVVISNKENVQTISVTITNTTTERKSYAKERRGKPGGGRGYGQNPPGVVPFIGDKKKQMLEAPPEHNADSTVQGPDSQQGGDSFQSRQDYREQTRPKRYSSQRQRNAPETGYPEQPPPVEQKPPPPPQQQTSANTGTGFYNQAVYPCAPPGTFYHADQPGAPPRPPRPPGPPPQETAAFGAPMMQPPIPFHLPVSVSSPGIPSPPRLFGPRPAVAPPPPVPISSAAPPLLAAPYLAAPGVIYTAPLPPPGATAPYQIPLGYTSPPPAAPPPAALAQPSVASPPQTQSEMYRGGTTYYPPYLQQPPSRSPARRPKVAIPIVDPLEAKKKPMQHRPEQRQVEEDKDTQPLQQTLSHQPQQVQMQQPQEPSLLPQHTSATEKPVSISLVEHVAPSSAECMESAPVEPKAPPNIERETPISPPAHASNNTVNVIGGSMHKGVNFERVVSPSVEHKAPATIEPAAPIHADESSNIQVHQNTSSPPEADPAPSDPTPIISTDSVESEAVRSKVAIPDLQPSGVVEDGREANVPAEKSQLQSEAEAVASS